MTMFDQTQQHVAVIMRDYNITQIEITRGPHPLLPEDEDDDPMWCATLRLPHIRLHGGFFASIDEALWDLGNICKRHKDYKELP